MQSVEEIIQANGMPSTRIGLAHGINYTIKGLIEVELSTIQKRWESHLPKAFEAGTTQG